MRLVLVIRYFDARVSRKELEESDFPCVLGRDGDLSRVLVADHQASRAHCKISFINGALTVEDLASRNGTYLNQERITRAPLRDGDVMRIGATAITVEEPDDGPADELVGTNVLGFRIDELIGQGRGGKVYRAQQVALNRPVALKVMAAEIRKDAKKVAAFLEEARRAGRLNHPNVVQVHDIVQTEHDHLIVMELLSGSVGDQMRVNGPLDENGVWALLGDIGKALAYAESQHLVHRDVKPDNILYTEEGTCKLADLGIAAQIGPDGKAVQDRAFGSPHYIAPEQARGGAIDGRADLYALGATAWHLLTGNPVYSGSVREVIAAHLHQPLPDLRRVNPAVSHAMVDVVVKLMQKDPAKRFAHATDLVAVVEKMLNRRTPGRAPRRPLPVRRVRRYRPR